MTLIESSFSSEPIRSVIAVPASRRPALYAAALFAAATAPTDPVRHGHGCEAAWCTLTRPTDVELTAIVDDADRILARYATDSTALGRQCAALGATMKARAADVRMLPYMWRVADADGRLMPVTGDAHPVETVAGSGAVHVARGYDALNPDRGLPAIVQTTRHEFAHLSGAPQSEGWGLDIAAALAVACAP